MRSFKIPEDDGNDITRTFFNPDREGWLIKEGPVSLILHLNLLKNNNSSNKK